MVKTEKRQVTTVTVKEIPVGRFCDCCGKEIQPVWFNKQYNYFVVHTYHHDWGNDSIDSNEYYDACGPECAAKMTEAYLRKAFDGINTMEIEIEHTRCLEDGTDREYPRRIDGMDE